ncbi:MAG TPA: 16S rRNA (guanine(966)-N(2))-methyltransferase RsmD [Candidatus Saccharimonadales bacterium]|nr:16S rRNA (guanine(966)-N(2))-methyltransferase RsmD [Candidatus Saccharimonadales bacterium]
MRVIAGKLGGRVFSAPHGHRTHPMSDRVRGALFNTLGDISGLTVLDAFAGSGALSFEALSRGAASALAIEPDKPAQLTIAENIAGLGLSNDIKLVRAKAQAWLNTTDVNDKFDIVICDPPYDQVNQDLLIKLAERAEQGGTVIFSLPPDVTLVLPHNYKLLQYKDYGDATLSFFRRTA